jgi:alkylation response protein AidB-like acyl-CoA dehydrogenase
MLVLPMSSKGVTVQPIRQMDGEFKFNEVTIDNVCLDGDALLGCVGDGWKLAQTTLGSERLNLGAQAIALFAHLDEVVAILPRSTVGELWSRIWLLRVTFERLLDSGRSLSDPGFSMLKLAASELQRDIYAAGANATGMGAIAWTDAPVAVRRFLAQPGQTIAGGTSEIQRNVLAERVLGLPREPRPVTTQATAACS